MPPPWAQTDCGALTKAWPISHRGADIFLEKLTIVLCVSLSRWQVGSKACCLAIHSALALTTVQQEGISICSAQKKRKVWHMSWGWLPCIVKEHICKRIVVPVHNKGLQRTDVGKANLCTCEWEGAHLESSAHSSAGAWMVFITFPTRQRAWS